MRAETGKVKRPRRRNPIDEAALNLWIASRAVRSAYGLAEWRSLFRAAVEEELAGVLAERDEEPPRSR